MRPIAASHRLDLLDLLDLEVSILRARGQRGEVAKRPYYAAGYRCMLISTRSGPWLPTPRPPMEPPGIPLQHPAGGVVHPDGG
jgi:hypothetical protein